MKKAKGAPTKYSPGAKFEVGALVEHVKFGVGIVTGIEPNRVEILFEEGPRKLVS